MSRLTTGHLSSQWLPSTLAGTLSSILASLVVGLIGAMFSVSFAMLIFAGELADFLPAGIAITLFSGIILRTTVGLMSSYPGMIADTDALPSAILGLSAAAIAAQMLPTATAEDLFVTVLGVIALTSLLTGSFLFLLGFFKWGELIRFIPYPVIGGFLAGAGWLLVQGAVQVITGTTLIFSNLAILIQPQALSQCLMSLGIAIILLIVSSRSTSFLAIPITLFATVGLFYLALFLTGTSTDAAASQGWLLESLASGQWRFLKLSALTQIDGAVLSTQLASMSAIALLSALSVLLNSTGIELITKQDIDLNRELKAAGSANLILALAGGITGYQLIPDTVLADKMGANTRLVSLLTAIVYAAILIWGFSLLSLFPLPVMGALLLFLGLSLLKTWLYDTWLTLPKTDYVVVWVILLVMVTIGFLQGIGFGFGIAIILFVISYSQVSVTRHVLSGTNRASNAARFLQQARLLRAEGDQIYILELQGFVFFGTAHKLLNRIRQRLEDPERPAVKFIALDFRAVSGLDSSAVLSFVKMQQIAQQRQLTLVFTNLSSVTRHQLLQGGTLQEKTCQFFTDLDRGIEWCENKILETIPQRRRRTLPLALQLGLDNLFTHTNHVSCFVSYLQEKKVLARHVLFHQGDCSDRLYFIESGQVTVFLPLKDGQTRRLQTLVAGMSLGEQSFYLGTTRRTSAVADQPSTLYYLSKASLQTMCQQQPQVAVAFQGGIIRLLAERLTYAHEEIEALLL